MSKPNKKKVTAMEAAALQAEIGHFDAALRDYQRAREFCRTPEHVLAYIDGILTVHFFFFVVSISRNLLFYIDGKTNIRSVWRSASTAASTMPSLAASKRPIFWSKASSNLNRLSISKCSNSNNTQRR